VKTPRRIGLILLLLVLALGPVAAKPYVGISQTLAASSAEVGFLTKGFEQNLVFSVPTLQTEVSSWLANSALSAHLLYRFHQLTPFVVGVGVKAQGGWQQDGYYALGLGGVCSLSYEFLGRHNVLFVEASYVPWIYRNGSTTDEYVDKMLAQYVRVGYRCVL